MAGFHQGYGSRERGRGVADGKCLCLLRRPGGPGCEHSCRITVGFGRDDQTKKVRRLVTLILMVTLVAGCAGTSGPGRRPESRQSPSAPSTRPVYNLSGYSAAFKDGYVDGCETAKKTRYAQKDGRRFSAESQYRQGWNDGFSLCRRK